LANLEEIIGDLDYENMEMLRSENPNIFIMLITKIFNLLGYLANYPIQDEDGQPAKINLYRKVLETLVEKNTGPNGEKPAWLEKVITFFHYGVKAAAVVDEIGKGKIPDVDMFMDALTMNMMDMSQFTKIVTPSVDNILL